MYFLRISLLKFFVPLLIPVLAALLQWEFWPALSPKTWIFLYPAVFFSASIGGLIGGLIATCETTLLAIYVFIPPQFSWDLENDNDLYSVLVFSSMGVVFSLVFEHLKRTSGDLKRIKELEFERQKFFLLAESSSEFIGMCDLDMNPLYVNPEGRRMVGLPDMAAACRVKVKDYYFPEDQRFIAEEFFPRVQREGHGDVEIRLRHFQTGEPIWMFYYLFCVYDDTGIPVGWATVSRNITERRQAEAALRESEREFRVLAEAMPQIVWATGADGRNIYYNRKWSEYTGLTLEESYGDGWITPFHPDDRQGAWDAWQLATQQNGIYSLECRLRRSDGIYRWWLIRGVPLFNDEGEILKWYGTCTDIQDLKEADLAIRESEARLHYALEMCNTGAWEVDLKTRAAYRSIEHARIFGYADTESPWSQEIFLGHVLEEDRPEIAALVEEAFLTGGERRFECRIRRTDAEIRWIMGAGRFRVTRLDGKKQVAAGIIQDITERKNAQRALEKLNDELEERVNARTTELATLNQSLESFVYSVSHDLKTPLRGIDGYCRLLLENFNDKLEGEAALFMQNIREGINRMNDLIDDLLDYSRMSSRDLEEVSVNIPQLLENILQENATEINKQAVKVDINLPLPSIHTDKEGLALVMRNLLGNAIKFSQQTTQPHICVGAEQDESTVTLWVKDNGIGFDMKYVDRIFEIFQRLHRLEDYPGTGIGLALVKTAMQRMGGKVWAESQPGQGATFYLTLKK